MHGLDFVLELRQRGDLLLRYERIFALLVAAGRRGGLERENHGMGYHFHYLTKRGKGCANVLPTFDPDEISPPDSLYWQNHADGAKVTVPANWGLSRIRAVYDAVAPTLVKPGKAF